MKQPDTLQEFGIAFQKKVIIALLSDHSFLAQSFDILQEKFFESEVHKWIISKIKWYYETYKTTVTSEVLAGEWTKINDKLHKTAVKEQLINIYVEQTTYIPDLQYIKDRFIEFCKNKAIKDAIMLSVDYLDRGDFASIKSTIDRAFMTGSDRNIGHDYKNDLEVRTSLTARNTIETPWQVINEILDGGLGAGELCCLVGNPGGGKSYCLQSIAAHAMKLGKTVAYYTLELSDVYSGLRLDTLFTGIESNKIRHNKEKVKSIIDTIPGSLIVKYFPPRSISAYSILAHIQQLAMYGKKVDLVIVDYADLLKSAAKSSAKWEELEYIFIELRGMCGELGIPLYTVSQAQRSASDDDVIEGNKIAGSYGKVMTSDVIISLSRKTNDKLTNTGRFHIIKNRFGVDGLTFPAFIDLVHGQIEIYDPNSSSGIEMNAKMENAEQNMKQYLRDKFVDYNGGNKLE